MPIMSKKYPQWVASGTELREMLGLKPSGHLPPEGLIAEVQGYKVEVVSEAKMEAFYEGYAKKPHRIFAQCKTCRTFIPAGRLQQHEPACNS